MKSALVLFAAASLWFVSPVTARAAAHERAAYAIDGSARGLTHVAQDTLPIEDRAGDFVTDPNRNPIDLRDPAAVTQEVEYDPATNRYIVRERIGDAYYRSPTYLTFEEYQDYRERQRQTAYFDRLQGVQSGIGVGESSLRDPIDDIDVSNSLVNRLFGGTEVTMERRGNIDLTFGVDYRTVKNPAYTVRQQRNGGFDFNMNIQLNVNGSIGKKLTFSSSYNNNANFTFDRQLLKVNYNAAEFGEDQILQNIEGGNVSLPLRSNLIQGSQGLFGVRADLKFGHLKVTTLVSQQKTKRGEIEIQGGAQFQEFEVRADEYDENRHFFLSHYNRSEFEGALENLPNITSLFKINRIEVWITNDRDQTEGVRELVALADLGEPERITNPNRSTEVNENSGRAITGALLPDNGANDLYATLIQDPSTRLRQNVVSRLQMQPFDQVQARDFERVRARLLSPTEYSFHPELGFVSVNVNVRPDQVLAVAYEYTYNGQVYKVGEFSNDLPVVEGVQDNALPPSGNPDSSRRDGDLNVLYTRLLKSTTPRVDVPAWDLMMKNFYNIGAYQVNREDFRLDITYEDPGGGQKRFLPTTNLEGEPLIRVFNVDQLNVQLDPQPDGIFDFVTGLTIYPTNGRIMFPVLEPFGSFLEEEIEDPDPAIEAAQEARFVYDILYDSTVVRAREYPEFNRFVIRGSYKSAVSNELSLGAFNIPRGSVRVSAGGQILREGTDYEIDYNIGRVKILNDAYLNSGVPLKVAFEDNSQFGLQQRTMIGVRADYELGDNMSLGATYLHLFERPFTQKVNVGDDPINNRIYGLDFVYGDEAPWLTRFVDKIPGISTKEPSSINFSAEAAFLKPSHAGAIEIQRGEGGTVYVDDFEGSASGFDLKTPLNAWTLASTPQGQPRLFPEATNYDGDSELDARALNANRALLNWYRIDQVGTRDADRSSPYAQQVQPQDIFPGRQLNQFNNNALFTFDLTYYPYERGPYNYDVPGGYGTLSRGLTQDGELADPETRWGGVMRDLTTNDFQAANIEYLEFWVLSPFLEGRDAEGDLYIEFGNISEDVMRDSRLFFENGLPAGDGENGERPFDETAFGRVPRLAPITPAFDTDPENREQQDLGFDGLDDVGEREAFADWLNTIRGSVNAGALTDIEDDPSNDNFESAFNSGEDDAVRRYRLFNGPEGNAPLAGSDGLAVGFTTLPDTEDVNGDNTLSENESYFQYRIPLQRQGQNGEIDATAARYITQVREVANRADDGSDEPLLWYRFKVPLDQFDARVGSIQDFRSIRFMRMYLKGFDREVTLRFARLDLVRNQWRRYLRTEALLPPGPKVTPPDVDTYFDVDAINIEENAERRPFGYVLPAGIQREQQANTFNNLQQNEQAQVITVCGLEDGDARAIYKIVNLDMRVYDRLRMFVHAEEFDLDDSGIAPTDLKNGDLTMFVRLGSDFQDNYYEYELPLRFTRVEDLEGIGTDNESLSRVIWPEENDLDLTLRDLVDLKLERNQSFGAERINVPYTVPDPGNPDNRITIVGNPNLGLVKGVMIGLRNGAGGARQVCSQVWVNELRLTGLDERGGAAGLARLDMQLADFGTVSASGSFASIGWGSLDQKLAERARESNLVYDVTGSFELGKFLPEKSGVRIPTTLVYSNNVKTPEYDPYDLDIKLKDKLDNAGADRDSLREQAVDRIVQRELNFTNVRKERTSEGVPLPWDISNFSATYVYNETDRTNPLIELDETLNHYAALDYTYAIRSRPIEPFKKLIKNTQYFNLLRDFNFNPLPTSFSVSTTMDRVLQSTRYRFAGPNPEFNTFFNRNWTWDRDYNFNWDLSRGLRFQFNATNRAVIDEAPTFNEEGDLFFADDDQRVDSVWANVLEGGRNKAYQHRFDVNYTLPTKQIPYLDFTNITAQYTGSYNWNAAAQNLDTLGNVITNAQQRQIRGDLNFEQLYRKSKYLQKIENPRKKNERGGKDAGDSRERRSQLSGRDIDEDPSLGDAPGGDEEDGERKKKDRQPSLAERILVRPLLSLRRANVTYSEEFGTTLPGFLPDHNLLGLEPGFGAPGWDFVAGLQPDIRGSFGQPREQDYLFQRVDNFSSAIILNDQIYQTYSENLAVQASLEPFKDFRVDLELQQRFTENHSEFFKDTLVGPEEAFARLVPADIGSYTISYSSLSTLFGQDSSGLFNEFEANRVVVSQRLAEEAGLAGVPHPDSAFAAAGYQAGFGPNQQEVQLAAFLAAYTDQDPEKVSTNIFKTRPRVNWRLTYNGLARLDAFKDIFATLSVTHSYKSSLTVNSFNTNLLYDGPTTTNPATQSFYTRLIIPDLVITDQFSPLIGIDARLKNDMSVRASVNKSRSLGMSFVDNTLSERSSEEYALGYGYIIRNVDLLTPLGIGGKKKSRSGRRGRRGRADDEGDEEDPDADPDDRSRRGGRGTSAVGNDLEIQVDIRFSDDETFNRQLDQIGSQATRGARTFTLSPSAEYEVNKQLSLRLFMDYRRQDPKVSNSFPTRSTQAGLTVRFKLQ